MPVSVAGLVGTILPYSMRITPVRGRGAGEKTFTALRRSRCGRKSREADGVNTVWRKRQEGTLNIETKTSFKYIPRPYGSCSRGFPQNVFPPEPLPLTGVRQEIDVNCLTFLRSRLLYLPMLPVLLF